MTRLTWLDAEFADGNVMLGVLLGLLGACSTIRAALPEPARPLVAAEPQPSADRFVALLLGVVALHGRLTTLVDTDEPDFVDGSEPSTLARLIGLTR